MLLQYFTSKILTSSATKQAAASREKKQKFGFLGPARLSFEHWVWVTIVAVPFFPGRAVSYLFSEKEGR